jgi:hypothetical protein
MVRSHERNSELASRASIAIAAAQNRRDDYGSYGYAPGYYGGGPVYYGGYGSSVPYFHGHPNAGW